MLSKGIINKYLFGLCIVSTIVLCAFCANFKEIASVFFTFILFCLPGSFVLNLFTELSLSDLLIFGVAVGMAISSFFVSLFVFTFGWHLIIISLCIVFFVLLLIRLRAKKNGKTNLKLPEWSNKHYTILGLTVLIVLFASFLPLVSIGKLTEHGFGYTWLIGHDFLWRVSVAFSVARELPAECFDFSGNVMRYYVLFYAFPAFAYNILQGNASMEAIMIVSQILLTLVFVCVFFATARSLFKRNVSIVFIMASGFFTYSYIWVFFVLQRFFAYLMDNNPILFQKLMLIKWMPLLIKNSAHSHTFYRFILVQPHVLISLSVFLMSLCFLFNFSKLNNYRIHFFIGSLTGIILGFELSIGAISALIIFAYYAFIFIFKAKQKAEFFKKALLFCFGLIIIWATLTPLGMYSKSHMPEGTVKLFTKYGNSNIKNLATSPVYLPLEYGPAAVLSFLGLFFLWKKKKIPYISFYIIMMGLCLLLFLLTSKVTGPIKLMRFLPISFLFLSGYIIDQSMNIDVQSWHKKGVIVLLVLAIPSYFTDIYIGSDVNNTHNTVYVSEADMKAAKWVKVNTDNDAIIQGLNEYQVKHENRLLGFRYEYSLMPCFADRKAFLGRMIFAKRLFASQKQEARQRKEAVFQLFENPKIEQAASLSKKHGIDYIYVGQNEKEKFPYGYQKFNEPNKYFRSVYENAGVSIYQRMIN